MSLRNELRILREFLGYLRKPFAFRKFKAFLKRNLLVFVLAFVAALGGGGWSLHYFNRHSAALMMRFKEFEIRDPATFDIDQTWGVPQPAIDPDGDLVPITDRSGSEWALWSLSQKRAILYANGPPMYLHRPMAFFNKAANEYVIACMSERIGILPLFMPTMIRVLDADTLEVKRKFQPPDLLWLADLSPSGRYLCGMGLDFYPMGQPVSSTRPLIIDLQTGKVRRESIHLSDAFFLSENEIMGVRNNGILRYDLRTHRSIGCLYKARLYDDLPKHIYPQTVYSMTRIDAVRIGRNGSVMATAVTDVTGPTNRFQQDIGYIKLDLEASDQPTSFTLPSKYSWDTLNAKSKRRSSYYGLMPAYLNPDRNLAILERGTVDAKGAQISREYVLVEVASGRGHLLADVPTTSPPTPTGFFFVNSDVIARWNSPGIQFISVDEALALPEPPL